MLAFLYIPGWFWHPLQGGNGYNFWSGFGSDIGQVSIVGGLVTIVAGTWMKHNCHVHRCWRLSWHPSAKYGGHPVCRRHHEHSGTPQLKEKP